MKIFVDQPNLDFDQADRLVSAQDITLAPEDLKKLVALKFVKFQKVATSRILCYLPRLCSPSYAGELAYYLREVEPGRQAHHYP